MAKEADMAFRLPRRRAWPGSQSSFAPGGHLPALVLAVCAVGLAATLFTGRYPAEGAGPRALHTHAPQQPPKA
jgi:hypothetical protein